VHLVGFIIRNRQDAGSREHKNTEHSFSRLDRADHVSSLEQKEQRIRFRFGFPKKAQAAITYSM